jgi:hypothetical protein
MEIGSEILVTSDPSVEAGRRRTTLRQFHKTFLFARRRRLPDWTLPECKYHAVILLIL